MTAEGLLVLLEDLQKETEHGKLKWHLELATSEYREKDQKPVVHSEGEAWVVDECFVGYSCRFRGEDFAMITYERIETADTKVRTTNMVFAPPIAMRIFQLDELAPYAVDASAVLTDRIHKLWETLLNLYKQNSDRVSLDAREIEAADV